MPVRTLKRCLRPYGIRQREFYYFTHTPGETNVITNGENREMARRFSRFFAPPNVQQHNYNNNNNDNDDNSLIHTNSSMVWYGILRCCVLCARAPMSDDMRVRACFLRPRPRVRAYARASVRQ